MLIFQSCMSFTVIFLSQTIKSNLLVLQKFIRKKYYVPIQLLMIFQETIFSLCVSSARNKLQTVTAFLSAHLQLLNFIIYSNSRYYINLTLKMSIYSGFATRQQEQAYDDNIATLLFLMQKRLNKFYKGEAVNEVKFIDMFIKVHNHLKAMEQSKYLEPKLSHAVNELLQLLKTKKDGLQVNVIGQEKNEDTELNSKKINNTTKRAGNSKVILDSIRNQKVSMQKLTITERTASISQSKVISQTKPAIVKKRVSSNVQHRSFVISAASHSNLKSSESDVKGNVYQTPKQKQLQSLKKDRILIKDDNETKRKQEVNIKAERNQKSEGNEDVRDLIKGYLVRKKKQHGKDLEWRKQQFKEIFQQF